MPPQIVRGTNTKPALSDALVQTAATLENLDGQLIVGFPLLASGADQQAIDAILVSPTYGAVLFDLAEHGVSARYQDNQDELVRLFQTRLLPHKELYARRRLAVDLNIVTIAAGTDDFGTDEYPISTPADLSDYFRNLKPVEQNALRYDALLSAIQNISRLRASRSLRSTTRPDSRGAKLQNLEASIATLDHMQSKAVIETIEGVQRIRGLAGSGKTVILALKAAYLHAQHPDWRIAVTYNTRSLHEQFRRLISQFCIEQSGEEPDWEALRVQNAWGAPRGNQATGLYAEFCLNNGVEYRDFRTASAQFGRADAFKSACEEALTSSTSPRAIYDAILIDEAQDFPPSFLRLAYAMLREPRRLVYAYDELQSLDGSGLPGPDEIFGTDANGNPLVSLARDAYDLGASRDIVLDRCYRNSRPVLSLAHAVGFGIYREKPQSATTPLVQMFDHPQLWRDIGYTVERGSLEPGSDVLLSRSPETSPAFLEEHSTFDDLIQVLSFPSKEEQDAWVSDQIQDNIRNAELRHDDIVVINPNGITARRNLASLRSLLLQAGVKSHVAGVDTAADVFFNKGSDSITFTGIHRAKGNEAGMVYVVNAQEELDATINLAQVRNRLFTAITRSKAWVRILGVGPKMEALKLEYERARQAHFKLDFVYPTEEERMRLRIVHREVSSGEARKIEKSRSDFRGIVESLSQGSVAIEDLDDDAVVELRRLLRAHGDD